MIFWTIWMTSSHFIAPNIIFFKEKIQNFGVYNCNETMFSVCIMVEATNVRLHKLISTNARQLLKLISYCLIKKNYILITA